jgi:transcription factor IIIB subunit 2
MKRAWISTGRRPNGLCGAAILIAARYHGFKRNITQIVRVVHVCQETIRKRLDEFKFTNTAKLTREEFAAIESKVEVGSATVPPELEETMDPPCFIRNQSKKILEIEDGLDDIHKMIEEKACKIEQKLEKYETPEEEKESEAAG